MEKLTISEYRSLCSTDGGIPGKGSPPPFPTAVFFYVLIFALLPIGGGGLGGWRRCRLRSRIPIMDKHQDPRFA